MKGPGLPLSLVAALLLAGAASHAAADPKAEAALPQIWIKSGAHLVDVPPPWRRPQNETGAMWEENAPWPTVASHVKVAEFPPGNIQWAKDADLQKAFAEMKRRNIALALGTGLLTRTDHCQAKNEATAAPGELEQMLEKIRRNGGELRYIAMDEPYFYGHRDASGCHESAAELAKNVAANVAIARRIFPDVKIGDGEVIDASRPFIDELAAWADAYRAAVGENLAFMQTDISWSEPAMRNLKPLSSALKARNIPIAFIYNADAAAVTDASWQQSAEDHIAEIETRLDLRPDIAVFDSWVRNPSHVLPETTPGTLTNIALRYLRTATFLTLENTDDVVKGRLTDARGQAVANARIAVEAVDVGAAMGPQQRSLSGTVPATAATAIIGMRANLEGSCVCDGPAAAIVGGIHYAERGTNRHVDISPVSLPIEGAPASVRTLKLTPGMNYAPNFQKFPVTPGATFDLSTSMAATANASHAGYVTIIFIGDAGKDAQREFLWFEPSHRSLGEATTDADGIFQMKLPSAVALAKPTIRATFAGDAGMRAAIAEHAAIKAGASTPALVQLLADKHGKLVIFAPRKDFFRAFENGASWPDLEKQWKKGSAIVNMFALGEGQIRTMPDDMLARLVHELNNHHVALGIEILATNWFHEPPCGGGVEGYSDPGSANSTVAKLLRAGASPSMIRMDEPLFFGHYYQGKNACRSPIENVAQRTAVIVKIYTAAFPDLIVGDAEPFPAISNQNGWQADYAKWVAAFHAATGTPLSFTDIDINWSDPRLNRPGPPATSDPGAIAGLSRTVAQVLRANKLAVGMYYTGFGGGPLTDARWMAQAREHMDAVEHAGIAPDHVIITSWDPYPALTFPETNPDALSSLLAYYADHYRR